MHHRFCALGGVELPCKHRADRIGFSDCRIIFGYTRLQLINQALTVQKGPVLLERDTDKGFADWCFGMPTTTRLPLSNNQPR
jgi:hypothetical protein